MRNRRWEDEVEFDRYMRDRAPEREVAPLAARLRSWAGHLADQAGDAWGALVTAVHPELVAQRLATFIARLLPRHGGGWQAHW